MLIKKIKIITKSVSSSCGVPLQMTAVVWGSKMLYEIRG
jgi:hypothetical protein